MVLLEVPFISQRMQPIHQEDGCGVACLLMALGYHGLLPGLSFSELCQQLSIEQPPERKGYPDSEPKGVYPEDLHRFLIKEKFPYRTHFYPDEWQDALQKGPICCLMAKGTAVGGDVGHWLLMIGATGDSFTFLDAEQYPHEPEHRLTIKKEHFFAMWTGIACQLLPAKKEPMPGELDLSCAMKLLAESADVGQKVTCLLQHPTLAPELLKKTEALFNEPIQADLLQLATGRWHSLKKLQADDFVRLQKSKEWQELAFWRKYLSTTIQGRNGVQEQQEAESGWQRYQELYFSLNLVKEKLDRKFFEKIFTLATGKEEVPYVSHSMPLNLAPNSGRLYLPYKETLAAYDAFLVWVQEGFSASEKQNGNPLVYIASTFQRFLTIHPFTGGNGRTARMVADLLLKHYGLLPAYWQNVDLAVFAYHERPATTSDALFELVHALDKSYQYLRNVL